MTSVMSRALFEGLYSNARFCENAQKLLWKPAGSSAHVAIAAIQFIRRVNGLSWSEHRSAQGTVKRKLKRPHLQRPSGFTVPLRARGGKRLPSGGDESHERKGREGALAIP